MQDFFVIELSNDFLNGIMVTIFKFIVKKKRKIKGLVKNSMKQWRIDLMECISQLQKQYLLIH